MPETDGEDRKTCTPWWESVAPEEVTMAKALCGSPTHADSLVHPALLSLSSPGGPVSVIMPEDLVPYWTQFLWQAQVALRTAKILRDT